MDTSEWLDFESLNEWLQAWSCPEIGVQGYREHNAG